MFIFSGVAPLFRIVAMFLVFDRNFFQVVLEAKPRQDDTDRSVVKSPAITHNQNGNFSDSFVLCVLETGLHKRNHISVITFHCIRSQAKLMQIFSVFLNLHVYTE